MSCIAYFVEKPYVYLVADSSAVTETSTFIVSLPSKLIKIRPNTIICGAGSFKDIQVIENYIQWPKDITYKNIVTKVLPQLYKLSSQFGLALKEDEKESYITSLILIASEYGVFFIEPNLQVLRLSDKVFSYGVGSEYVMGYLNACQSYKVSKDIPEILVNSLQVASKYLDEVKPPFVVDRVKLNNETIQEWRIM